MGASSNTSGGFFTTRNIIIGLVAAALTCCICATVVGGVVYFVTGTAAPFTIPQTDLNTQETKVGQVGVEFLTHLKNGEWAAAYALCTPAMQKELISAAELSKRIASGNAQPVSGVLTVIPLSSASTEAEIDGTVVLTGNRAGTVQLYFTRVGNNWQVNRLSILPTQR